ncbi:hypothetical protein EYC80_002394 [Monilinia laxa]|uniref:CBM-cenC domain-containing protein n=1 Tax=Monilinia laxa TaxID=61186 RepID=A0A5N6K3N5_MONLA|nr:hypothetical protein EYC80_002394 [Monilinia laxa]
MKSFACFSVIFLARFALSENSPSCTPQIKYCVLDDSLQALRNQTTSGPQFCSEYLEDDSISLPLYVPAAASASSISSACSCLIEAEPTSKPAASTNSSYILGSASSSVSATELLSPETTAVPAHSPVLNTGSPSFTPIIPQSVIEYTTSTIYALSTYTTHVSGQAVTKTLSVVNSTTVYPTTTQVVTRIPHPQQTMSVEYITSAVHTLSTYTNAGGDVVTKTIVDYTTVYTVTEEPASAYITQNETSTAYKLSTYTTLGRTVTATVVDYTTFWPVIETIAPAPHPAIEYTTSTVYILSTVTYINSGKTFTFTGTVVDTTILPVTKSYPPHQIIPAFSTPSSASSTDTKPHHSRTRCTKGPQATQPYPFTNSTSSYVPAASGSVFLASASGTAYSSSVRNSTVPHAPVGTGYLLNNSTVSNIPQETAYLAPYPLGNPTRLRLSTGTGLSASSTAYLMPNSTRLVASAATGYSTPANSTTSYIPLGTGIQAPVNSTTSHIALGTGYPIPINSTTPSVFPTSNSSLEIVKSSSELPGTISKTSITSAAPTISSSYLPSVTAFCSTDAAALLFAASGTPVTSYCSSLLSIQPTFVDGGYKFITQTAYTTRTSTVAPASVTVFKRNTESDPYLFTSTYNMDQQSSACSCLSIQAVETSVTTTIIVPEQSKLVTSTAACTPIPTQAVVNGDFESATSGSYQSPWTLSSAAYVQSSNNNAFPSYSGTEFAVIYGNSGSTGSISQSLSTLVPNQSYTLTYYMRIMGAIALPTSTCVLTTSIGGTVVDTLNISYSNIATYRTSYVQRTASVVATSQTDTLKFAFSCGATSRSPVDLLLDNVSMVGAGTSCGVAP